MKYAGLLFFSLLFILSIVMSCSEKTNNQQNSDRPAGYGTLACSIVDNETGEPIPARVYARGSDDSLYAAVECIEYERPNFGPRVGYTGRHFTTIGNTFTVYLPEGNAVIIIERGKEYIPLEENVVIKPGEKITWTYKLKRWISMADKGWYSGDTHVHRTLGELAGLLQAEDLNVAIPQTVWGNHREPDLDSWINKADRFGAISVDNHHVFSVLSHEIERFDAGAVLMHFTGKTEFKTSDFDDRSPTNLSLIEQTHNAGGYCDLEKPMWPESHIDVAVGKADFIGLCNNHMLYKSYLPEHPRLRTEFKSDYSDGVKGYVDYVLDLYYAYLNCGFKVMPSAGSASGVLPNPLGYNRVYVKNNGEFSYEKWFEGLKAGRCFATNGPMLFVTVDDRLPGETITVDTAKNNVYVSCEVYSANPIERLDIIRDGEVVFSVKPKLIDYSANIGIDIPFTESCWITVRCFEEVDDNVRFARSAPVFVNVQNKPFIPKEYAALYFFSKTEELIKAAETDDFKTPEARKATMEVYKQAKMIYSDLLKKAEK
ncbi:MAG: CehA/McbA family metallohydrolase [Candidatus Latescibacteria bacterium]|nr:CehA/McbA family metallohydrolase [Candidatus Latescibacterota bacterium]